MIASIVGVSACLYMSDIQVYVVFVSCAKHPGWFVIRPDYGLDGF